MNNLSILKNEVLTMSSREIAELTGKEHKNVKRDIDVMCSQLKLDALKFELIYFDSMNRQKTEYHLNKELTLCLVSGYNAHLRMAIIKRWQELEDNQQPKWMIQLSPEAQIALNDLSNQLEVKTKKVEQLEGLFHSGGTIAQFAKQLNGVNSQQVNIWLYANTKWLYDENKGKVHLSGRNQGQPKPSSWRCAAYARDRYLTETNYNIDRQGMESIVKYEVQLLAGGKRWLFDKYVAGKLPMKSDWNGSFTHKKDLN